MDVRGQRAGRRLDLFGPRGVLFWIHRQVVSRSIRRLTREYGRLNINKVLIIDSVFYLSAGPRPSMLMLEC